jgi:hypothetical protein
MAVDVSEYVGKDLKPWMEALKNLAGFADERPNDR